MNSRREDWDIEIILSYIFVTTVFMARVLVERQNQERFFLIWLNYICSQDYNQFRGSAACISEITWK